MAHATRLILLTLVAMMVLGVLTASTVRAQDDDDDDGVPRGTQGSEVPEDPKVDMTADGDDDEPENLPEEEEEEAEEGVTGLQAKTVFLSGSGGEQESLPAGEWVDTVLAFDNSDDTATYTVRFVAAHLNQIGDASAYVQNFTGNTYERVVDAKETGSFKYRFKPHESLDPRDYNLVIRVFFSTANNETLAIAAFNSTITIADPLGTDPEMIMTIITVVAIIAGAVYYFVNKKSAGATRAPRAAGSASPTKVEMGTSGSFDKSYVPADHLKFQQALNDRKSASPKRSSSKK